MRRVILLALFALTLPVAAFANSGFDFTDSGALLGTSRGFSLSGSALFAMHGLRTGRLIPGSKLDSVSFILGSGFLTNDVSVNLTMNAGKASFDGPTQVPSETNIVVPEPGTLVLLGTGLVGIAGLLRKMKNN
jgi:PEP-CTERM motif-containing protein